MISGCKEWIEEIERFFNPSNPHNLSSELLRDIKLRMLSYKACEFLFDNGLDDEDKTHPYINIKIPDSEVASITKEGFEASVAIVNINDEEVKVFSKVDK